MTKSQSAPYVLLGFNLLIISALVSFFLFNKYNPQEDLEVKADDSNYVLGTETQADESIIKTYLPLKICLENTCVDISSNDVASLYNNDILDVNVINIYVNDKILPYFQNYYGGITMVKNRNGFFYTWMEDKHLNSTKIAADLKESLQKRDSGLPIDKCNIYLYDLPGTDGTYATKYIEIDNSKQKLYVWNNGKVIEEIKLSGPKYGFQVYGVFPIIDKGVEPQAPSGRYMPYWMAFYHSISQNSWYGLHGLVWWYDSNGKQVLESENNIGVRRSAGCIRMLKEDAKYLYENFEKGDKILIHE